VTGHPRDQTGSAALLAVALIGCLVLAALLATAVGGVVTDQRRVESAADLAALAGAGAARSGLDGCAAAASTARRNGAVLSECRSDGDVVTVAVRRVSGLRLVRLVGEDLTVVGRARAGPVGLGSA
jgi:secretion/DNA translocation related TadE-like protein